LLLGKEVLEHNLKHITIKDNQPIAFADHFSAQYNFVTLMYTIANEPKYTFPEDIELNSKQRIHCLYNSKGKLQIIKKIILLKNQK